jgi:hypothetical protein
MIAVSDPYTVQPKPFRHWQVAEKTKKALGMSSTPRITSASQLLDDRQVVGDQQVGEPMRLAEPPDQLEDPGLDGDVERAQ